MKIELYTWNEIYRSTLLAMGDLGEETLNEVQREVESGFDPGVISLLNYQLADFEIKSMLGYIWVKAHYHCGKDITDEGFVEKTIINYDKEFEINSYSSEKELAKMISNHALITSLPHCTYSYDVKFFDKQGAKIPVYNPYDSWGEDEFTAHVIGTFGAPIENADLPFDREATLEMFRKLK